jgi:RES domain-containing protein
MLYCGATLSFCALENLVHSSALPIDKASITIEIPGSLHIETVSAASLPAHWDDPIATNLTKDIGTDWVKAGSSAVLAVPSAVIHTELNYLLNPAHPDFKLISFTAPTPFRFDYRLK